MSIDTDNPSLVSRLHTTTTAQLILVIAVGLTVAAWYVSRQAVQDGAKKQFEFRAEELETAIHDRMIVYEQVLWGGAGLFNATDEVSREHWHQYVSALDINEHWPGIQGMGFSVPIDPDELDAHVASIRAEGFPEYEVRPSDPRDEYTSIIYLEPFDERNQRAFGFDMWSNDLRRQAMTTSRDSGLAIRSGAITLVQETDDDVQPGFLTYVPVYASGTVPTTTQERRDSFEGWVYAAFRIGDLMEGILGSEVDTVTYQIFDGSEIDPDALIFESGGVSDPSQPDEKADFETSSLLDLQGREWLIKFSAGSDLIGVAESRQPTYIGIAGLTIDLLLFLVIASQRRAKSMAESLAKSMTARLRATTDDLEAKTIQLQEQTDQLVRSNQELEQFAYAASHDLQEPLRAMGSYANLLAEEYETTFGPEGSRWLGYISAGAQRMTALLRELLGYASIDGEVDSLVPLALDDALASALLDLSQAIEDADVQITQEPLPIVLGNEFQMERLFLNLIGNAIKFRSETEQPQVWIRVSETALEWRISVTDNGIGIKPEYHQRIFEIFRRVSPRSEHEGTGIGLAVCEKIVAAHGGTIGVESTADQGSQFWFTLPRTADPVAPIDLRTNQLASY